MDSGDVLRCNNSGPSALGAGQEVRYADDGEPILKTSFRLATGIPGPELRFRILFLHSLRCRIGFPEVGGDTNAPLEPAPQRNMPFRRVAVIGLAMKMMFSLLR